MIIPQVTSPPLAAAKMDIPNCRVPLEITQLRYSEIIVDQERVLGCGQFGTVYRAKCDQLQCAAKYLHCEGATEESIVKMEMECQLLSAIRHPNIIQCLGTVRHANMNRPVILMEIMEENLTCYLERMTELEYQVPFYIKVNICHDIALGLAYLHSKEIIHGSLSSNNVLIAGESHAKVTDYWMRQLSTRQSSNIAYMPPECQISTPKYTKESDSFSFGVLAIQVDTQCYPQPENEKLNEIECQQIDINRMERTSHFLSLALDCLKNDYQLRPKMDVLCSRLAVLKDSDLYSGNKKKSRGECKVLNKQISVLKTEVQSCIKKMDDKDRNISAMKAIISTMESEMQQMSQVNDELVRKIEEKESLMKRLLAQHKDLPYSPAIQPNSRDEPDFPVSWNT